MASKNSRRNMRARISQSGYARARPNISNWIVGGSSVDNTGGVIGGATPTGPTTWTGGGSSVSIVSGVPTTYQAVVINSTPNTSTPTIGRMRIDEIKGNVCITRPSQPGRIAVAVGIYVAEFNSNTGKWDVRDPLNASDAARDDYFFLEGKEWDVSTVVSGAGPAAGQSASADSLCFDLTLSNALVIGGGQALHVTVSYYNVNGSGGPASLASYFRTRVGPVA